MKKVLFVFLLAGLFSIGVNAQDDKGNFTIDLNFNPAAFFDANAGPMFQLPYIKGRYFINTDLAARLGFNLSSFGDKFYLGAGTDDYVESSSFSWTFAPGIEKQFGNEKFVVYLGGDIPFSASNSKRKTVVPGNETEEENPGGNDYFAYGINGVVGVDFYLLPNLYVGAEFTPGFVVFNYKDEKTDGTVTQTGGSSSSFQLGSSSGIRLGVRF